MITIIGAGIGGLTLAVALQRKGHAVSVYEAVHQPQEVGAGISLWPNATNVLQELGLLEAVVPQSGVFDTLRVSDEKGNTLSRVCVDEKLTPALCIHRAALVALLRDACAPETIHYGERFARYDLTSDFVRTFFEGGRETSSDILLGADGIHSRVRQQMWRTQGATQARSHGYIAWRGVTSFNMADQTVFTETWGKGSRFGLLPLGAGRVYWYATSNAAHTYQALSAEERKTMLLERFAHWHVPVSDVIAATDAEAILCNDCLDNPPTRGWYRGRVCLTGDAAHATTPNMGQGGCLAIEDAAVLAEMLDRYAYEEAFPRFEQARYGRTSAITRRSQFFGMVGQWESPVLTNLRNLVIRLHPDAHLAESFNRVYRFSPERA